MVKTFAVYVKFKFEIDWNSSSLNWILQTGELQKSSADRWGRLLQLRTVDQIQNPIYMSITDYRVIDNLHFSSSFISFELENLEKYFST